MFEQDLWTRHTLGTTRGIRRSLLDQHQDPEVLNREIPPYPFIGVSSMQKTKQVGNSSIYAVPVNKARLQYRPRLDMSTTCSGYTWTRTALEGDIPPPPDNSMYSPVNVR